MCDDTHHIQQHYSTHALYTYAATTYSTYTFHTIQHQNHIFKTQNTHTATPSQPTTPPSLYLTPLPTTTLLHIVDIM